MLLTVDIGNTHIIIGGFQIKDKSVAQTPSFIARFLTEHRKTDDQYAMAISQLLSLYHIEETSIYKSNRHYTYVIGSRNQNRAKYQN